jgi:hypothetical protein
MKQRCCDIRGDRVVGHHVSGKRLVEGPEALVEDLRKNPAVGIVPTRDSRAIASVQGISKDRVLGIEHLPTAALRVVKREPVTVDGGAETIDRKARHERWEHYLGPNSGRDDMCENGRLCSKLIEGRQT